MNTLLEGSGRVILAFHTTEIVLFRAVLRVLDYRDPGYESVRAQEKSVVLNIVGFLEKLNVSPLRAFWWSRTSHLIFLSHFPFFSSFPCSCPYVLMTPCYRLYCLISLTRF